MEIQKRCKYCGGTFIAHKMNTIYCSPSCNNRDYKQKKREKQISEYLAQNQITEPVARNTSLNEKNFLTPREAAKILGVGKSTVYRELSSGLIKAVQLKGKTLIRRKDIERIFDNPPEYKSRSVDPNLKKKREYYTMRQIEEK